MTASNRGARGLLGGTAIYTLSSLACASIPFLMLPVLTRLLTPEDYGTVAMFSVVVALFGALTGLSVNGAVAMRYFDRASIDFPRYVGSCMAILGVSTIAILTATAVSAPLLTRFTLLEPGWLELAVVVAGAQFVVQIALAIWQSAKQPWRFAGLRLFQALLDAAASIALVIGAGLAWQGRLTGIALASLAAAVLAGGVLMRGGWIRGPVSREYVSNAMRFGLPLVPHALGGLLTSILDRFLLSNLLGVGSTGVYMVALQIGMVLGLFTDSFNRAYAPWLIERLQHQDPRRDIKIVRFSYGYFAFVTIVAVITSVAAPVVIPILVGAQFARAAEVVGYMAFGYAFGGMYYMVTNYVFFAGRTTRLAIVTFCGGALNVAASYFLIQRNGVVGAAQGFMLSQAFVFLGTWRLAHQSRPMPWLSALAWRPSRSTSP
ncbi:lipopolysaccharide biosynthesis protein [Paucibacter sp. B51]|uniref:lipopolysaccharide biosynthesis protein n=1 Tax=Paucibacter sp. B51 TaxID=2993315 RepID=UPI0022EBDA3F|nr:oligosaccharide flippase family protein [Paucibacter sp. B51]